MGEAKRRKALGNYPDTTQKATDGETVCWEVLGDLASHPKSNAVIQVLKDLMGEYDGYGGNTMLVTLEAPSGTQLIKVQVKGLSAFMGLISGMQALGLEDRLEKASGPERGIDAAFS